MKKNRIILLILTMVMFSLNASAFGWYEKTIKVGEAFTCTPTIAMGRNYSWSYSGNTSCVTRMGGMNGQVYCIVTGRSEGYIIITCEGTVSGTFPIFYSDTWVITVENPVPKSVTLSPSSLEIDQYETATVTASVSPSDAPYSLSWTSENGGVASLYGDNYSATITGLSVGETTVYATTDNNVTGSCSVKVWGISPTSVSVSGESGVYIGYTTQMTADFTPSTHHSAVTWSSDKPSVATIDEKGVVTGVSAGTAVIKATTANGLSTTKTITVTEPPFTVESISPENGTTNVTVFQQPSATYSLALYSGTQASGIKLYAGSESNKVEGTVSIYGKTVTFMPAKALKPFTKYTFLIPANGVKNQWGTGYNKDVSFSFTTGDVSPMTMTASMAAGYVEAGDQLVLKASESDAEIRYTLDGSEPSETSTLYTSPITITKEVTVWAKAYKNGYATPVYKGTYKISHVHVMERYPLNEQLYIYKDVNPYITYEIDVKKGTQFKNLSVKRNDGQVVDGKFILQGKRLVFVPAKDLELGYTYTVVVPEGAVVAGNGEPNKAVQWSFTTGEFIRSVSAGYQQAAAVKTDNTLLYWGRKINQYDGGDYTDQTQWSSPRQIASDVSMASCGYTHNLFTKTNGEVWGWGLQFCGEMNSDGSLIVDPLLISSVKGDIVSAGGQASAILKSGSLWMAGRNDFGQVGDIENMSYNQFQQWSSLSKVKQAVPGWQTSFALSQNGTLYGWGCNSNGLLADGTVKDSNTPKQIMTGVDTFAVSKWDHANVAVVKTDGTLWIWGKNDAGQIGDGTNIQPDSPVQVMDKVKSVAVGDRFMAAIDFDGSLWTWGDNRCGQLGDGSTTSVSQPQKVMEEVESIELGKNFAVALKADGSVWTWGANDFSQLGDGGTSGNRSTPKQILTGRERKPLQGVKILDATLQMSVGEQVVICAKPVPLQADYQEWTWTTSNASVATVDSRGMVTAIAKGSAEIVLTSDNGLTAKCTVNVNGSNVLLGDANSDGLVNVTDIVEIVNSILGHPSAKFDPIAADVNNDGVINVTDIVSVVNIILSSNARELTNRAAATNNLKLNGASIKLRNAENYTAAQFDINLLDGSTVNDISLNSVSDHQVTWRMINANTCRVIVYSPSNSPFHADSDVLFNIILSGNAIISNELLVNVGGNVTGVDEIGQSKTFDVYDLRGNKVRSNTTVLNGLAKGVYIVNGKKIIVK